MNIRRYPVALLAAMAVPGFAMVVPTPVPATPYSVLLHDVCFGGDLSFNDVESIDRILVDKALGGFPKVQARAEKVPARSEASLVREYDGDTAWSAAVATPVADPGSFAEIWLNGGQGPAKAAGAQAGAVAQTGRALKLYNLGFREWTLSADQDGVTEGVTFTYSSRQIVAF